MCGRYVLELSGKLDELPFEEESAIQLELELPWECYNIAPTMQAPILDAKHRLHLARWGLIPHWAKEIPKRPLINARSESVDTKNSFRYAYKNHRCAVPATAYFEWRREGKIATPFCITPSDGELFWFAGLRSRWGEDNISSFCILTRTSAGTASKEVHDRCPVVLSLDRLDDWLSGESDFDEVERADAVAKPYEVSKEVNKAANDTAENLRPIYS